MNTRTLPLWLLVFTGLEDTHAKTPDQRLVGPLERALDGIGYTPLDARDVARYRAAQVRDHSSWFAPYATWYRAHRCGFRDALEFAMVFSALVAVMSIAALLLAAAVGHGGHTEAARMAAGIGANALIIFGTTLVASWLATRLLDWFEGVEYSAATWLSRELHPTDMALLPREVAKLVTRIQERYPDARFEVENLCVDRRIVDPILSMVRYRNGKKVEQVALAIWLDQHVTAIVG
jgi:hypothetical protein